jgi:hypothetical protein
VSCGYGHVAVDELYGFVRIYDSKFKLVPKMTNIMQSGEASLHIM